MSGVQYWEDRARSYARVGKGLRAVCSYGMPSFYNAAIDRTQYLALRSYIPGTGASLLDLGCGVGRWSRLAANRGARVVGVDLSPTMIEEATRRAAVDGVAQRCAFFTSDLSSFDLGRRFDRILGVTVLQHILSPEPFHDAVANIRRHLAPGGRAILLEAAPTRRDTSCDTAVFRARPAEEYLAAFAAAGLDCLTIGGVDPVPLKTWLLPYYRSLPRPLAWLALLAATGLSFPIDAVFGRRWVAPSWHKLFVLTGRDD